jgi:5-formyltetrahydrofolate cyclo-ligase
MKNKIASKKAQLRNVYRNTRKQIKNRDALNQKIAENFLDLLGDYQPKVLASYSPIDGEVCPALIESAFKANKAIITKPVTLKDMCLAFFKLDNKNNEDLDKTQDFSDRLDLVIVPIVAFNAECMRLGFGGGYFDRLIKNSQSAKKGTIFIGVAYQMQFCPDLPTEAQDQQLDAVVTETTIYLKSISFTDIFKSK